MHTYENHPLYRIMHPRSVAFWGASSNPMGMGTVQLAQLLAMGYEKPVYPMHPRETEILGLKAYAHAKDLPGVPDLAVLVLPTKAAPEVLEECGQAGIKGVIIVSAGFGEIGEEGKAEQARMVEIARTYGIRFIGPNCIGVVNTYEKLNTTFFPYDAVPGFIGMASQSGSFITQMFVHLEQFGLGFSQGFSVGNEAMTDIVDCIEYLADCPRTKVIGVYIESIRHGRKFFKVAQEVARRKPIVAYYVGGSESGGKAVASHTGAMAGPDRIYDGIFRQCGIIRAYSIEELFDYCSVLGSLVLPKGNQTAILTHSGGPGAAAADTAERRGLKAAKFSEHTVEELLKVVPHTASVGNPVDLTFSKNPNDYTEILPKILLSDPNVHAMFIYMLLPVQRVLQTIQSVTPDREQAAALAAAFISERCRAVASLQERYGKPVVGGSFYTRSEPFIRELQDLGVPVLPSPERAMNALAALVRYADFRRETATS